MLQYRNNPAALELSRFRGEDLLHNNVLLTDAAGGLVAAQGQKPARFSFADAPWWQAAWNDSVGGVYLGDLMMDPERGTASVFIAVSVLNPRPTRPSACSPRPTTSAGSSVTSGW